VKQFEFNLSIKVHNIYKNLCQQGKQASLVNSRSTIRRTCGR